MKYLPCSTCHSTALATREGILHSAARLSSPSITYLCKRCGHPSSLTAAEFNLLPEMTEVDLNLSSFDLRGKP